LLYIQYYYGHETAQHSMGMEMNIKSCLENLKERNFLAKWVDNIETCLKGIGCDSIHVDWIQLAQDGVQWVI
jgi:hypothetical protein